MAKFVSVPSEGTRTITINVEAIRLVREHPDEDSVIVEFDETHKVYLGRDQAKAILEQMNSS